MCFARGLRISRTSREATARVMSCEYIRAGSTEESDDSFVREPWPEGQVYIADEADATKKMWEKWSKEDAYPLVFRQDLELKPEYKTLQLKEIVHVGNAVTHVSPKGKFVLPDGFHEYRTNGYARGGMGWSAAYLDVNRKHARLLDPVPPDVVFNTSDFDTVGCTLNPERAPKFPRIPEFKYEEIDAFLQYYTEDGTQPDKSVPEAWPGRYFKVRGRHSFMPVGMQEVTVDYGKRNSGGWGGDHLSWERLASFFDDKMTLNGIPLTEKSVSETNTDDIAKIYDFEASDERHEKGNLDALPARYGLADDVPYLMRIEGFGFVETPTIQVGQLIDTLSDYERCGEQNAVGIKAKYRRRLERLEHAWKIHVALSRAGYKHGPDSVSTTPFVLSDDVANELRDMRRSRTWQSFFRATDPQDNNNCRRAEVNQAGKKVVMHESVACDEDAARMNCIRMLGHPFKSKNKNHTFSSYAQQDEWSVRLSENLQPVTDQKRKSKN